MYVAKPGLCCILILTCWHGSEAQAKISMKSRVRVALAGETLDFKLSVVIPANNTNRQLTCYNQSLHLEPIWRQELESSTSQSTKDVVVKIKMHSSSFSGKYFCCFANQEVHWVVLVRDKGYQEPADVLENGIIIQMSFSGILLIFSVVGSCYILKSYKDQLPSRRKKNEVTKQRTDETDFVSMDEDGTSSSVYTALQQRPGSIYDMLNPEITSHSEHKWEKNSREKICKAQEDESDDVYENV